MSYLVEQRRTLSFLRLPFAAKRRRARPLVSLTKRAVRLVLWCLPIALFVVWLASSPSFELREYEMVGGSGRVEQSWVAGALAPWSRVNLLTLDLGPVRSELEKHPWVRSVELRKSLPGTLLVAVTEHEPVALLDEDEADYYLGDDGEVITQATSTEFEGLRVLVDRRPSRGELHQVLSLVENLQQMEVAWVRSVDSVEVLTPGDYELHLRDVEFPVIVAADTAREKLQALDRLLPDMLRRFGQLDRVDLRFSRRVVVQPRAQDDLVSHDAGGLG